MFPCILKILPNCIFNKKDPLVFGVKIEEGVLRKGTPLVILDKVNANQLQRIGKVESLEINNKTVNSGIKGQEVCVKIVGDANITYGRHFDHTAKLYSQISRNSIDVMKEYFTDDLEKVREFLKKKIGSQHKRLVVQLKRILGVI